MLALVEAPSTGAWCDALSRKARVVDRAVRPEAPFGCFHKQRWPTPFVWPGVGRPCRRAGEKLHWGSVSGPTPKNWSNPASSLTTRLL